MARRFREIENPERRIEKEGNFSQTTQFTPTNSRQADIPAKENSTYSYSQLNMKNRWNSDGSWRPSEEKKEQVIVDTDEKQTYVQRPEKEPIDLDFDISGDTREDTDSSRLSGIKVKTQDVSRGGISGTVAERQETQGSIKKINEVEYEKKETVQNEQRVENNSLSEEQFGTKYILDETALQERLETLQEQQRQDYKTFQMSAGMDFGNGYQSELRKNIYNSMQIRKAEMDKIKAQIDKGKTPEVKEPNTQLTVKDDKKHPVLRFILSILNGLNGKVDEANKKLDEIGENENNPILKWLNRMQGKVEKVLFPEKDEQNAIITPDRNQVKGAKSIYDIMEEQIAEDSKNAIREDTPHQAFVRELSGDGKYQTFRKDSEQITVKAQDIKTIQRDDEEVEK